MTTNGGVVDPGVTVVLRCTRSELERLIGMVAACETDSPQGPSPDIVDQLQLAYSKSYDPEYGDDKPCQCRKPYVDHFDAEDRMEHVGTTHCSAFRLATAVQRNPKRDLADLAQYVVRGLSVSVQQADTYVRGFELSDEWVVYRLGIKDHWSKGDDELSPQCKHYARSLLEGLEAYLHKAVVSTC